jgi:hypothetical protein
MRRKVKKAKKAREKMGKNGGGGWMRDAKKGESPFFHLPSPLSSLYLF